MSHSDIINLIKKIITKFLQSEFPIYVRKIDLTDNRKILINFLKELNRIGIIESYEKNYSIFWRINEKDASNIASVLRLKMIEDLS